MANQEHLAILKQGVKVWNKWREEHSDIQPDLSDANLYQANLYQANLYQANLHEANLGEASLGYAHLTYANLSKADLSKADLRRSSLVDTNLSYATLTNCSVYGISVWNVQTEGAIQDDLVITRRDEPIITVDNLDLAQFIYLLLNNKKIRDVIDTITSKVVLILGRFTEERKVILDALRDELRKHDYSPVLFDFEKPTSRSITETVRTLAHLARFILADITDPSSIPQELYAIVPTLAVPVLPLLEASKREYSMFDDLRRTYHWVLPVYQYTDLASLYLSLEENVINHAEQKAKELAQR